jgi:diguanylate cyclase (GGDEF)-like protein/putative nucleotidyltransferase with HDIG domain
MRRRTAELPIQHRRAIPPGENSPKQAMGLKTKLYIGMMLMAGAVCLAYAAAHWACHEPVQYLCLLSIAMLASGMKVTLPGIPGTMSVSYIFVLLSMIDFSYSETLSVACLSIATQSLYRPKYRPKLIQFLFNLASMAVAVSAGCLIYRTASAHGFVLLNIACAATAYFLSNTFSIAGVVALTEGKRMAKIWNECYFWSFPYYLVGGGVAALISVSNRKLGWEATIVALPVVYIIFRSYRLYLERLESEKCHAEQIAALHLRTIEALALAIEAKDDTTHAHLQRVQVYALELGKAMGLPESGLQALRAASILHDIGKLAVPEHIISKPGKLTCEEFEKMKIHPIVGAEILARVQFPYEVVPIVRAHHERWDGSGYPDGLKRAEIPLGARILSAVDCLDALASDRQYRRALPLDEAMAFIVNESGKSYDPDVVAILRKNYAEWEKIAQADGPQRGHLSKGVAVHNGDAPGAGLQNTVATDAQQPDFLATIAAARQEAQMLYELTQDLGNSLNLHETLSVLDSRLRRIIPYDAIAVYVRSEDRLAPQYVNGENSRLFASLEIPIGQGLSGWVAETGKHIINGNPSVEPGYLNDPTKFSTLRSAIAVPLENAVGITGVITLYHLERDFFTKDHLRLLLAVRSKVSLTIENALKYQQVSISATTDPLTQLPNARSLFLHLDAELARSRRTGSELAILVCDLDGFKQVNDRFGHLEGNKVLHMVAAGLRQCCREYDYVGRMGGDEFVIVLPGLKRGDLDEKLATIERVVVDAGLAVCGERLLNISAGAAFCPEHGGDAETLLAEADRQMYLVKQSHKARPAGRAEGLAALALSVRSLSEPQPASPRI